MLKKELLDILACPQCKGDLEYNSEANFLLCHHCRLKFKILEGNIPDMLTEDAEKF